jgi:erythromycin esterase-like protein
VRSSLPESFGALFHATGIPAFLLVNRGGGELATGLSESRLERAIGVVYKPETERLSHYFMAKLARQFDAVVFLDTTHAVVPLPR